MFNLCCQSVKGANILFQDIDTIILIGGEEFVVACTRNDSVDPYTVYGKVTQTEDCINDFAGSGCPCRSKHQQGVERWRCRGQANDGFNDHVYFSGPCNTLQQLLMTNLHCQ